MEHQANSPRTNPIHGAAELNGSGQPMLEKVKPVKYTPEEMRQIQMYQARNGYYTDRPM
jgi:hypothetical protein